MIARIALPSEAGRSIAGIGVYHDDGTIRIKLSRREAVAGLPRDPAQTVDVRLGQYPAGNYEVALDVDSVKGVTSSAFTVGDVRGTAFAPLVDYTDLWWDPKEPG